MPNFDLPTIAAAALLASAGCAGGRGATDASGGGLEVVDAAYEWERVWEGGRLSGFRMSPSGDGRYVPITGVPFGLARIDLTDGSVLTMAEAPRAYLQDVALSPDGSSAAYQIETRIVQGREYQIRVARIGEREPRIILRGVYPDWGYAEIHGWAGDSLLVSLMGDTDELAMVSVADGGRRAIKSFRYLAPGEPGDGRLAGAPVILSPDGRLIAHAGLTRGNSTADVVVTSRSDGREVARLTGPSDELPLAWEGNGQGLLFWSDRQGTPAIWRIELADDVISELPTLVVPDATNLRPLGVSRGALLLVKQLEAPRVRVADYTPDGPYLVGEHEAELGVPSFDWSPTPLWDPSGGRLAYVRALRTWAAPPTSVLRVHSLADGRIEEVPLRFFAMGLTSWTPRGTVTGWAKDDEAEGRWGLFEVDPGTGSDKLVMYEEAGILLHRSWGALSHDGSYAYFTQIDPETRDDALVRMHLKSGERVTLSEAFGPEEYQIRGVYPSPNGTRVVFGLRDVRDDTYSLRIVSSAGGNSEILYQIQPGQTLSPDFGAVWSTDQEAVFVAMLGAETGQSILRVPLHGGDVEEVAGSLRYGNDIQFLRVSPSGGQLAFVAGATRTEILALRRRGPGERTH